MICTMRAPGMSREYHHKNRFARTPVQHPLAVWYVLQEQYTEMPIFMIGLGIAWAMLRKPRGHAGVWARRIEAPVGMPMGLDITGHLTLSMKKMLRDASSRVS